MPHSALLKTAELNPGGAGKLKFILDAVTGRWGDADTSGITVLDIGCGRGDMSIPLAQLGYRVHGLDSFAPRIDEARASAPSHARFEVGDARAIPSGRQYDVILCVEVIERLTEPAGLLVTVERLLKPDGMLILTVPNGWSLLEIVKRGKDGLKSTALGERLLSLKRRVSPVDQTALDNQHPGDNHQQYFTAGAIRRLVARQGFVVDAMQNSGPLFSILIPLGLVTTQSARFKRLDALDTRIAPSVPRWLAGGWYLKCRRASRS